jgi:hypothetical protein
MPLPPPRRTDQLDQLPDDVLRRIIDTADRAPSIPAGHADGVGALADLVSPTPLKTAHALAAVSRRLRLYVTTSYLPSVSIITHRDLQPRSSRFSAALPVFASLLAKEQSQGLSPALPSPQ